MAKTQLQKLRAKVKKTTYTTRQYKGIKISDTELGYRIMAFKRVVYYASLDDAKKAIDRWERRQYKKDKR